ncbi:acetyltransferase [Fulvivirga kasyanovii]|uniref:Acetyltransferase n=1 Tax=Fulvivirga kasyanovii TaxID=396812 RepID=A0ABW9RKP4_9BACT|nr:acetyltransferase [Fulvivirga kasyanovii]MTI24654.1 acetyltransferase [Fulvivirga kasyanovii]
MKVENVYLIGAGGHAKVVTEILNLSGKKIFGVFDDNPKLSVFAGLPVLGKIKDFRAGQGKAIIAIGDNNLRKAIADDMCGFYVSALHPQSIISSSVEISDGTVVMAAAVINPDVIIGKHCIINTGASVDHDCQVGDYVHIAPRATICGGVHIGEGTLIGAGASIVPGVKVGRRAVIGAGSTVISDIPDFSVAVGSPAVVIKKVFD